METNLVLEGVKFMFLGMGTVFVFLIIMIGCMNLMSIIIHKFFPEEQIDINAHIIQNQQPAQEQNDNKKIVAAITAAIIHHRQQG